MERSRQCPIPCPAVGAMGAMGAGLWAPGFPFLPRPAALPPLYPPCPQPRLWAPSRPCPGVNPGDALSGLGCQGRLCRALGNACPAETRFVLPRGSSEAREQPLSRAAGSGLEEKSDLRRAALCASLF